MVHGAGTRKISLLTDLVKYYRTDKKDSTIPRFFISCHAIILLNPETEYSTFSSFEQLISWSVWDNENRAKHQIPREQQKQKYRN